MAIEPSHRSTTRNSTATREALIRAANRVALTEGITHMTLDAVAAKAGVSKGGLLYHFKSKDALIEGMMEYYLNDYEQRIARHLAALGADRPNVWLRAYLLAYQESPEEEVILSSSLLAAVAVSPHLLKVMQERYTQWQHHIVQTSDPILATIIRLALDGLWFSELIGLAPPTEEEQQQIYERLLFMIGDG